MRSHVTTTKYDNRDITSKQNLTLKDHLSRANFLLQRTDLSRICIIYIYILQNEECSTFDYLEDILSFVFECSQIRFIFHIS